jgi:transposase-like protein
VIGPMRSAIEPELGVSDEQKAALVGQILRGELTPREACESEGLSEIELKRWVRAYTRAARRAIDNQVAAALAAHGLEVDERPATEFSGSLDSIALSGLIQTIQYGKKDAQIRVEHDGETSQLWCVDGDVVDAVSASLTGSAAVYRILSFERGRLHAEFSPVQRARTVHASTQALMLEAARRSDECRQIRARLGDTHDIYVPSPSAPPESEIEPDQASVLHAFDGTRSIEQVVHDSEFPDLETLGLIARLLEQEWLVGKPLPALDRADRADRRESGLTVASSFMPLATSLVSRLGFREPPRRLWVSVGVGMSVVAVAFAIGFYSAQIGATSEILSAVEAMPVPLCGPTLAALPGGHCLDRREVTAGEYQACVRSGACEPVQREFDVTAPALAATTSVVSVPASATPTPSTPPARTSDDPGERDDRTTHCNAGLPGRESYPLNCVTFVQARRYCEWRGGRLPTRSEWEQAASPQQPLAGVEALVGGLSEWSVEPTSGVEVARERGVVLGGGLDTGAGTAGGLRRLYMSANAQGRSVGFRCVVQADVPPAAVATHREPGPTTQPGERVR